MTWKPGDPIPKLSKFATVTMPDGTSKAYEYPVTWPIVTGAILLVVDRNPQGRPSFGRQLESVVMEADIMRPGPCEMALGYKESA